MDEEKLTIDSPFGQLTSLDSNDEAEEIDEAFLCCVCLDLLYKPIVLACGHISCFWCVHRAMSAVGESHCPICRCPYSHFPSICQLLHFLLLKMYPVAYKRREKQVLEEEKDRGFFSPQLGNNFASPHTCNELNVLDSPFTSSTTCSPMEDVANRGSACSNGKTSLSSIVERQSPDLFLYENTSTISGETHTGSDATRTFPVEENDLKDGTCELVSIDDVLCVACKQLLFQPAVLNCGHVYCQSCTATLVDEALRCQLCQSQHPKGFLKVCLELDHLLEKRFPKEYALRREAVQLLPIHDQHVNPSAGAGQDGKHYSQSPSPHTWSYLSLLGDRGFNVHIAVGCDYCGMYPIVGERYKCKDCVEEIGFDLCGECYNTHSKLPGRFNQQHTPEHKFDLVNSNLIHSIMLRLVSEHSEDSSVPMHSDDASEDPEDGLPSHVLSDDAPEDQEGDTHLTT